MTELVKLSRDSQPLVTRLGGKSVGIINLLKNNYQVPQSFVLTTEWFNKVEKKYNLTQKKSDLYQKFNGSIGESSLKELCLSLEAQCDNLSFDKQCEDEIKKYYDVLTNHLKILSLRSSAVIEDNQKYSFAGVFNSYNNIKNYEDFKIALKKFISSVFNYNIIVNTLKNNIAPNQIKMAVLIQQFVPANLYGVIFTIDPTGKDPLSGVISLGSDGEKLMKGEGELKTINFNREQFVGSEFEQIIQMSLELEKKFGPIDVEWGMVNGKILFYQMRPITTHQKFSRPNVRWSRELAEERYPLPMSPLSWSILRGVFEINLKTLANRFGLMANSPDDVAIPIGHYIYANDSFFNLKNMKPKVLSQIPYVIPIFSGLFRTILFLPFVWIKNKLIGSAFTLYDYIFSNIFKFFIFIHAKSILSLWDKNLPSIIDNIDQLTNESIKGKSIDEIYDYRNRLEVEANRFMEPDLAIYIIKKASEWMIKRLGAKINSQVTGESFLILMSSGLQRNKTIEMAVVLDEMYQLITSKKDYEQLIKNNRFDEFRKLLSPNDLKICDKFMFLNGHLTVNWDFRIPTIHERPEHLCKILQSLLTSHERKNIKALNEEKFAKYSKNLKDVNLAIKDFWVKDIFNQSQYYLREFMRIDEEHHFYCSRLFTALRKIYFELGERFVENRVLDTAEDIFFLTSLEVEEICFSKNFFSRRYLIAPRKKSFENSFLIVPPVEFIGQRPIEKEIQSGLNSWKGLAASSGKACGLVKIINSLDDCHKITPGDIIVTASPNPVYSPLYSVAGGLIANTGSILSHALVSAREYDLPAVVGIQNIASILKEGQRVEVDGTYGIVTIKD